jgi:hypothetical protein
LDTAIPQLSISCPACAVAMAAEMRHLLNRCANFGLSNSLF